MQDDGDDPEFDGRPYWQVSVETPDGTFERESESLDDLVRQVETWATGHRFHLTVSFVSGLGAPASIPNPEYRA